jgi:ribosomal-protein-alanine N-acetyltransferase
MLSECIWLAESNQSNVYAHREHEKEIAAMRFVIKRLGWADAWAMSGWRYEEPYTLYNLYLSPAVFVCLRPLLVLMGYEFFSAHTEQGELVGLFTFTRLWNHQVELGLGLRPDMTGKGYGLAFVQAGLEFGQARYAPEAFQLGVAGFNQRAIKVYQRAGFQIVKEKMWWTSRGAVMGWEMRRAAWIDGEGSPEAFV